MIAVMPGRYPAAAIMPRVLLRHGLLALALLACALLVAAEFGDLNQVRIVTVERPGVGLGGHHGYAQLVVALAAAVMAVGAWRGSRPAAVALAVLGVVALLIVVAVDAPDIDASGLYGRDYESATASAATGFRLEAAGAVLLLLAGVLRLALRPRPERAP